MENQRKFGIIICSEPSQTKTYSTDPPLSASASSCSFTGAAPQTAASLNCDAACQDCLASPPQSWTRSGAARTLPPVCF